MLAVSVSAVVGTGIAGWAVADANSFYMRPIDHYGTPAYARRQPVADTFWDEQDPNREPVDQAGTTSTATSVQPAYRSAWDS